MNISFEKGGHIVNLHHRICGGQRRLAPVHTYDLARSGQNISRHIHQAPIFKAPFPISTPPDVSLTAPVVPAEIVIWPASILICGCGETAPAISVISLLVNLTLESPILIVTSLSVIVISAPLA